MSAPDGDGLRSALGAVKDLWAVFKEIWAAFLMPLGLGWWGLRKWSAARADERLKGDRTEQQRRDDAFNLKFARLDEQVKQHVAWLEGRAARAEAERERAEARADAAERERWRMEIYVERHEHALANARQDADAARSRADLPPGEWKPVPRPVLPGDPA